MSTMLRRWFRPADPPYAVAAALVGVSLFALSWTLLHHGFLARHQISDTPVYENYGDAMVQGEVPYRDFRPEYPPAALPTFLVPALGHPSPTDYTQRFGWIMLACGVAMLCFIAVALAALDATPGRLFGALAFAGVAPLALGSVVLTRFDLWPAAITAGALAAFLASRERLGSGLLGLGFAAKLYPALLLPLALAYVWRRWGRREALVCGGIFLAVSAVLFLPFAVLDPGGVWNSLFRQGSRPLQLESLGSALLLAAHQLWGLGLTMHSSHGSQNLAGAGPNAIAVVQSIVQFAAVVGIWAWFARGPATGERLVRASAVVVCAFVALGKVLSPQFLIWLIPLVPLVRGRRGLLASGLLGGGLLLTQAWFPKRYWDLALHFGAAPSWLVLARDLVLVAILCVLTFPRRRPRIAACGRS